MIYTEIECKRCGTMFHRTSSAKKYCGDAKVTGTCAWMTLHKSAENLKPRQKPVMHTFTCYCGKEFSRRITPSKVSIEHFCSLPCSLKYSWYTKHGWLFGRNDLKTDNLTPSQFIQQKSKYVTKLKS